MRNAVMVYEPNTPCRIGCSAAYEGKVTAVMIEDKAHITYRVVWYDDSTRREEWLHECEIDFKNKKPTAKIILEPSKAGV